MNGCQQGKSDLLACINEAIDEYYADGTYDKLYEKWITVGQSSETEAE